MKALLLPVAALSIACVATARAGPATSSTGERAFQKCYSCHSIAPGEAKLTGPQLGGIVGRRIASEPAFEYSPALRRFGKREPRWTAELLDRYIADPEALVPGTSMAFNGIPDPAERAALIDYLSESRR